MAKEFAPNFRTAEEDLCKEEKNKLVANMGRGNLESDFRDFDQDEVPWETEQVAKSHGIYLEFDRAKTGSKKDYSYMVRITIPGGGPLNKEQWRILDEISEKYTVGPRESASIRLTTRQNIQYHWIKKENLVDLVRTIATTGYFTLNGCGDNTRNVMACPLSRYSDVFNGNEWAAKAAEYFRLPAAPHLQIFEIDTAYLRDDREKSFQYAKNLLNRKFKIAFSAVHRDPDSGLLVPDNCVEVRTNDLGVVPVIENNAISGFQLYVGGGQGEKNGKATMAALGKPVCFVSEEKLLEAMDAVVQVHQDWGDRQNRHWARVKYVIRAKGTDWYREQMEEVLGEKLEAPNPNVDIGDRMLHHGWSTQATNGKLCYGAFLENGRIIADSPNGKLKDMVQGLADKYDPQIIITPNQDLLFCDIEPDAKDDFEADLASYGYGKRNGKSYSTLRLLSGACVGRDTCRLTYTDSEKFEPFLVDELEEMGWGDMRESIGITGCERQCFRPSTKTIGLIGTGLNRYQFRLMATEDGRHQGGPLLSTDKTEMYLKSVPRDKVASVIDVLFRFYKENKQDNEAMGYFHRRIGMEKIIAHLKANETTAELMAPSKVKALLEDTQK